MYEFKCLYRYCTRNPISNWLIRISTCKEWKNKKTILKEISSVDFWCLALIVNYPGTLCTLFELSLRLSEMNPCRYSIPWRADELTPYLFAISRHRIALTRPSTRNLKRAPKARILTCTLSVIPLSLWMNSVVERALSDSCCRFCDSSVCNSRNSRHVRERAVLREGFGGRDTWTFVQLKIQQK